ncbi:MAG: chemotaxis protein CheB, partial [Thermoleophilia bacterium]|nr:chemotaxis protein CheB [Thermoleophilia bacterium]
PEALARILPELTAGTTAPLFIVQHFPAGMTRYFADSLSRKSVHPVVEAADGEEVRPSMVYVAPAGRHMVLRRNGGRVSIGLNDLPPENLCRPSVDVFFRSVGDAYPRSAVAVVLTGMGSDGASGLGSLKRAGAYVIAQDEATSVVWGMPGAAVGTNLVDAVLPVDRIASAILSLLGAGGAF